MEVEDSELTITVKKKPELYNPIDIWYKQSEKRSEAQKAEIPFQSPDAVASINAAVLELQTMYAEMKDRMDAISKRLFENTVTLDDFHSLRLRVKGLEEKRGPGRPPKVQEG